MTHRSLLLWHVCVTAAIVALLAWWISRFGSSQRGAEFPTRPVQVVVPFGAGGGSDTFVRVLQQGIVEDGLMDQPLVIINQAGGTATIGSRAVKDAEPDGYKILCLHNAIITAKLSGLVDYGIEAFEPIAMTGELSLVIMVREDAPFADLREMLQAAAESPKQLRFGANQGAPAYYATLQLEQAWPGAEFSIVSADGGADRYAKILGGHLDAGIFSLSEYLDFLGPEGTPPSENVRAIAIMSPKRSPTIPDVPTAVEQNIPVLLSNAHYWWAPKGTPGPIIESLASVLEAAMRNETVRSELARLRVDPVFEQGDVLQQRLEETIRRFETVVVQKQNRLPNFTLYIAVVVGVLLFWTVVETIVQTVRSKTHPSFSRIGIASFRQRPGIAASCFLVLVAYVYVLGTDWVSYAWASAAMVFIVGVLMTRGRSGRWLILFQLACLTGLGTEFIFTEIFETPLPGR
jgi:tripartite-type tricarboxylate transporter receptor subunit TctC